MNSSGNFDNNGRLECKCWEKSVGSFVICDEARARGCIIVILLQRYLIKKGGEASVRRGKRNGDVVYGPREAQLFTNLAIAIATATLIEACTLRTTPASQSIKVLLRLMRELCVNPATVEDGCFVIFAKGKKPM